MTAREPGVDVEASLAELLAGQRRVEAELRELRGEVAELRAALPRPVPAEPEDADLLALVHAATEGTRFSAFELADFATLPDAAPLRAALVEAVGEDLAPQRVGKLLERLARLDDGDVVLERVGRDRLGVLWSAQVRK